MDGHMVGGTAGEFRIMRSDWLNVMDKFHMLDLLVDWELCKMPTKCLEVDEVPKLLVPTVPSLKVLFKI